MRSDLTLDQKALGDAMSSISEAAYSACWMTGLEFALWDATISGETKYGQTYLKKEAIEGLRELSEKCGGWIVFDDEKGEIFVSLAQWIQIAASPPSASHLKIR